MALPRVSHLLSLVLVTSTASLLQSSAALEEERGAEGMRYSRKGAPLLHEGVPVGFDRETRGSRSRGARILTARKAPAPSPCSTLDTLLQTTAFYLPSANLSYVRPSDVLQCSRTRFAYNSTAALRDLESVSLYLRHFYSAIHLARKSPDPANLPVSWDVLGELAKLKFESWRYKEDFYVAMAGVVEKLNDAHTGVVCTPHVSALFRLALPLVAVVEGGEPVVRVAPAQLIATENVYIGSVRPFNFSVADYAGALVTKIDGAPAWPYMLSWATKNSGGYLNIGQRVNNAFAGFGWDGLQRVLRPGEFAVRLENPGVDFVTLALQRVNSKAAETVQVPWITEVDMRGAPFSGTIAPKGTRKNPATQNPQRSLFGGSAVPGGAQRSNLPRLEPMIRPNRVPKWFRRAKAPSAPSLSARAGVRAAGTAPATLVSSPSDLWQVYRLSDAKTCVLAVGTFDLVDAAGSSEDQTFLVGTLTALYTLISTGCPQVIIDLSGNLGGVVKFGTWLVQLLVGMDAYNKAGGRDPDYFRYLADTSFVDGLVKSKSGYFSYDEWYTGSEQPFTASNSNSFFYPKVQAKFGSSNISGNYSNTFKPFNATVQLELKVSVSSPALGARKLLLLSDGLCYSACSRVAHILRRKFGVRLVTVGGVPGSPMAFGGGAGGFVTNNVEKTVLQYFPEPVRSQADAPQAFVEPIQMSMRLASGFYNESLLPPLEYTFLPGDYSLPYSMETAADFGKLYLQAAKLFI